jgi:hypothetical protein
MVHTVTYKAVFTSTSFPAGTVLASTSATLSNSSGVAGTGNLDATGTIVFPSIADGTYTLTVQNIDSHGNNLGNPYIVSVVVSDPPVMINVPTGGTVTIS